MAGLTRYRISYKGLVIELSAPDHVTACRRGLNVLLDQGEVDVVPSVADDHKSGINDVFFDKVTGDEYGEVC